MGHKRNVVWLCRLCHGAYDNHWHPGILWFPADIQYFINRENEDYEYRKEEGQQGRPIPKRKCPTAADYLKYQQDRSEPILDNAVGGFYQRYYLLNFLPGPTAAHEAMEFKNELPLKSWHGSPIASFLRAFHVHGSAVKGIHHVPRPVMDQLRELQLLYIRPDPPQVTPTGGQTAQTERIRQRTGNSKSARTRGSKTVKPRGKRGLSQIAKSGLGNTSTGVNPTEIPQASACGSTYDSTICMVGPDEKSSIRCRSTKRRRLSSDGSNASSIHYWKSGRRSPEQFQWGANSTSNHKAYWKSRMWV